MNQRIVLSFPAQHDHKSKYKQGGFDKALVNTNSMGLFNIEQVCNK